MLNKLIVDSSTNQIKTTNSSIITKKGIEKLIGFIKEDNFEISRKYDKFFMILFNFVPSRIITGIFPNFLKYLNKKQHEFYIIYCYNTIEGYIDVSEANRILKIHNIHVDKKKDESVKFNALVDLINEYYSNNKIKQIEFAVQEKGLYEYLKRNKKDYPNLSVYVSTDN